MTRAWEGYEDYRHPQRRRRRARRWRTALIGVLVIGTTLATMRRCLPQQLFSPRHGAGAQTVEDDPAKAAVVIFNENDPLSRDLADTYAGKRGIDADRVVGLKCAIDEEISREDYDRTIATPLREIFDQRNWWTRSTDQPEKDPWSVVTANRIEYLVLIRGIPLRIRQTANYPGDHCAEASPLKDVNSACVDSELAALGFFTHAISGFLPNPYFRSFSRFAEARRPPGMMLVGRLDAPTGSMVRQMIDDSLAVEKSGLWGRCYLDGRGMPPGSGPLAEGDEWIAKVATDIAPYLWPTVYDNRPAMFSAAFPMTNAAVYFGWYSEQPAGPFTQGAFRFRPGAVACHIHSFSATSVRDPFKWWVGPLLDKGAAAVLGNVYEPYLSLTTHLDLFADRLFDGFTLAEAAYAATPGLSWMNTVVGDPLYRPALAWKQMEFDLDDSDPAETTDDPPEVVEGRAYRRGAQTWRVRGPAAGATMLQKSGERLHSGTIFEGLGLLEAAAGDTARARSAFEKAVGYFKDKSDKIRVDYESIRLLVTAGNKKAAAALLAAARAEFADQPAAAVLDELKPDVQP